MNFSDSPFSNTQEEYTQILHFISTIYGYRQQPDDFPISRVEIWTYEHVLQDEEVGFFTKNCHIWRDHNDDMAGLFISEDGEHGFHLITHPAYPECTETMLSWVFEVWAVDKEHLWTELSDDKTREIELYAQYGLTQSDAYRVTRVYDLTDLDVTVTLPEGFSVKSADDTVDIPGYVALMKNAFDKEFFDEAVYDTRRKAPSYSADLDITVYSPDDKAVATCTGWVDVTNTVAEIETVGTHSEYRRKGLARAVMTVCLQRLKEKGYTHAFISSFNDITHTLYDSFPFKDKYRGFEYVWKREEDQE